MLKSLVVSSLLLFTLGTGYAQVKLPDIPDFERKFDPSVSHWLIDAEGPVWWKSTHYFKNNEYIREIHGHCDLDVTFLRLGVEKIYVGFITRINKNQNTIETIVYNNGVDSKNLSAKDSALARTEHINTDLAWEITHELADYNNRKIKNLETEVQDTMLNGSVGFQEGYFMIPKNRDSYANIRYKGDNYVFQTFLYKDDDGPYIYVDLTAPDPKHPGERINVIEKIQYLKIYFDKEYLPYKVEARANTPLGKTTVTATYEP